MPSLLEALPLRKPALARGEAAVLSLELSPEEQDQVKVLLASVGGSRCRRALSGQPAATAARTLSGGWSKRLRVLKYLITVASFSRFLSEEILQNPQWLEEVPG